MIRLRALLVVPEARRAHRLLELGLTRISRSGSKVITDPGELDPDLLELLREICARLRHRPDDPTGLAGCRARLPGRARRGRTGCAAAIRAAVPGAGGRFVVRSGAVAALELLARAAPARIVAADALLVGLHDRPGRDRAAPSARRRGRRRGAGRGDRVGAGEGLVLVAELAGAAVLCGQRPTPAAAPLGSTAPGPARAARGRAARSPPRGSRARARGTSCAPRCGTRRADPSGPCRAGGCPRACSPCSRGARASAMSTTWSTM